MMFPSEVDRSEPGGVCVCVCFQTILKHSSGLCVFVGDVLVQQNHEFWRKHKSCGEVSSTGELKLKL